MNSRWWVKWLVALFLIFVFIKAPAFAGHTLHVAINTTANSFTQFFNSFNIKG